MRSLQTVDYPISELTAHPLSAEIFGVLSKDRIEDLKNDIDDRGLQYPLEIDNQKRVICGSQRLKAITELGWTFAPCLERDDLQTEDEIRAHLLKDNVFRRQLTPGQMYKAGKELERIYGVQAKERMIQGAKGGNTTQEPLHTADRVAADLGTSASTYDRLKTVYESGDDELRLEVEAGTKSISAAAKEIKAQQQLYQGTELSDDDGRRLTLRFGKVKRQIEVFTEYIESVDLKELDDWRTVLLLDIGTLIEVLQTKYKEVE